MRRNLFMPPRCPKRPYRSCLRSALVLGFVSWLLPVVHAGPAAASGGVVTVERERYLMGTRCSMHLEGSDQAQLEQAASAAFDEIARLEGVASNWQVDSELNRFHRAAERAGAGRPVPVSSDLFDVLARAQSWHERSGGAFDATVEPLTRLYDLRGGGRIPS